ncbi:polysaccharide export protein [Coccidioides immitis RS]|uniref:Polysaccharide export protein n=2 Tax=Coccidioides immitis TaxID=5501 RepID=J3KFY0_COCIM|nr:polysaccharide export protein [Coccidioides immitis RS]EAS34576.3 polysaccharide export protein [Coccidioides immitis RS]KMU86975.1 hypothetical protein CIHG_04915 [Coccidioides immitis H538.4]TPX21995.1 hypothetical protein DIZ76_015960 [Coccidioides immitis]
MFRSLFHRPPSRARLRRLRWLRLLLLGFITFFVIDLWRISQSGSPSVIKPAPPLDIRHQERVFIASIHWNNESILRSHWNDALLDLVQKLGPEHVYVSVLESGSWDGSKDALRALDTELEKLGVERKIVLEDITHIDEIQRMPSSDEPGWIWTVRGKKELRRIPYLSRLRNRVMDELTALASRTEAKRTFDKVLWLNDVVFTAHDALNILGTREGDYAAACSLDFSKPPAYYDTFALRDSSGAKAITHTWPYFLSSMSRHAMMAGFPVPVQSCWNGIVAFDATPFYERPPLVFRGISDGLAKYHLEGSECCLIHADNPLTPVKGVWLNPDVRVGYNEKAYANVHPRHSAIWPSAGEKLLGIWQNRVARLINFPRRTIEDMVVSWRVRSWKANGLEREEHGVHCLINEMQVLVGNGWAHL